jgi:hypothetical protein
LPRQTDEPRPMAWVALRSQPVAVIEGQGGRLVPIWVGFLGTEREGVAHPPTRIAVSRATPDRATLDMVV